MENKIIYTTKDISIMFSCSLDTARKIIREVKSISNILNMKGRILKEDLDLWMAYRKSIQGGN